MYDSCKRYRFYRSFIFILLPRGNILKIVQCMRIVPCKKRTKRNFRFPGTLRRIVTSNTFAWLSQNRYWPHVWPVQIICWDFSEVVKKAPGYIVAEDKGQYLAKKFRERVDVGDDGWGSLAYNSHPLRDVLRCRVFTQVHGTRMTVTSSYSHSPPRHAGIWHRGKR